MKRVFSIIHWLSVCCLGLLLVGLAPLVTLIITHACYKPPVHTKALVCCAFNEDVRWLHKAAAHYDNIYLYIKNANRVKEVTLEFQHNQKIQIIPFQNIGSCDHIYLYHIITHYDHLPDQIAFTKGSSLPTKRRYYYAYLPLGANSFLYNYFINTHDINSKKEDLKTFSLDDYSFTFHKEVQAPFQKSPYKNFEDFLLAHFTEKQVNNLFKYSSNIVFSGNFFVNHDNIKRYPKEMYVNLFDEHTPGPNREIDHFQERLWGLLFSNTLPNPLEV